MPFESAHAVFGLQLLFQLRGHRIFGYPSYLIYPLGIAKVLGRIAIWTRLSPLLKEWAYAGFFFDVLLAFAAHYTTDGAIVPSLVGLVLVLVSRFTEARVFASVRGFKNHMENFNI